MLRYLNSPRPLDVMNYVDNMVSIVPRELFEAMQLEEGGMNPFFKNPWEGIFC